MIYKVNIICSKKEKITTRGILRAQPGDCWEAPLGLTPTMAKGSKRRPTHGHSEPATTSAPSTGCVL
jgi:hypothetical protein